jgi:hypothetical protein
MPARPIHLVPDLLHHHQDAGTCGGLRLPAEPVLVLAAPGNLGDGAVQHRLQQARHSALFVREEQRQHWVHVLRSLRANLTTVSFMHRRDVVVISAGGVHALRMLAAALPADFAASVCVVQHIGPHKSVLPALLEAQGPLAAAHPVMGEKLRPGRILLAPPDHHLLLQGDTVLLTRGPKEHHARPAVDPLFCSAALSFGPRVIGVLLAGALHDGSAGLQAIKQCGGLVVVQDPADAEGPACRARRCRWWQRITACRWSASPRCWRNWCSRLPRSRHPRRYCGWCTRVGPGPVWPGSETVMDEVGRSMSLVGLLKPDDAHRRFHCKVSHAGYCRPGWHWTLEQDARVAYTGPVVRRSVQRRSAWDGPSKEA